MKKLFRNIILIIVLLGLKLTTFSAFDEDYSRYRDVDIATFKEYGFKISKEFFILKKFYEIYGRLPESTINKIELLARKSFNYLPEDIENDSYYSDLITALEKGKNNIDSELAYSNITNKLVKYLKKANIGEITGKVVANPSKGNAPLIVTLRADVKDPEGTLIPEYNYVWWIDLGGRKKILGNGPNITYTFKEQGKYSVFCDVRSNHKNKKGYTDVLSYRGKVDINILSKIASVIIKVNGDVLGNREELKFTPDEAKYGLVFDATSTVPTGKTKIIRTYWNFGNGVVREYNRGPKIERVSYSKKGEYKVKLEMETNTGDIIEKEFIVFINYPIATINLKPLDGYLGDKFTFSAKTVVSNENLSYNWEIIDIADDKVIFRKQAKTFTYNFPKKGYFNVRLKVNLPYKNSEDIDNKIMYISSRAPNVNFTSTIPFSNKPNLVLLDASRTIDPDYTDNGKLKYSWLIDGEKVELDSLNKSGSIGYYLFNSIGNHIVTLEVTDPDNIKGLKTDNINIKSILSVDFDTLPRATKVGKNIFFKANSKNAVVYEWDFGDGTVIGGKKSKINHKYEKSGKFKVTLKVEDIDGNKNSYSKDVYISNGDYPIAILDILSGEMGIPVLEKNACKGEDAYILNRVDSVIFDAKDSVNIDGEDSELDYSLKIGNNKFFNGRQVSYKFDELGCFNIKLTVISKTNGNIDTKNLWVKVKNIKPSLSSVLVNITDSNSDPVIVDVKAIGAKDRDGVITSYLWYYYTDINSEPQDFRITTLPNTKFVLPKITGNYYFVVILTDDNGVRVSSEDLGKKSSIILAGDNINVPLVDLNVNDSSLYIGEEVVFSAKVKNILGANISNKSKYYWDFDGDGFYDQESITPTVTYNYNKSGTFYAKLKVRHKGFSNTRFVEINVANKLSPDFKYISIGDTFLFINTSKGMYDSIIWDLGDDKIIQGKDTFIHKYNDKKLKHIVKLKLVEGIKIKTKELKVLKNLKNLLKIKKSNFSVFSYPNMEENNIYVENQMDYIYIYPYLKNFKDSFYIIDSNVELDTDLNGGKDDDENIKTNQQKILKVKLNNSKIQKIAVYVKNRDGIVIDSKIIIINKKYINVNENNNSEIRFINLTDSQKEKINYIKEKISLMPSEYKNNSLSYLQRLQEEWNDDTEKTKVILEFEGYLDETNLKDKDELIDLLEGLLVENQEDKSEKNIAYTALRNIIPDDVNCINSGTGIIDDNVSCKDIIIEKLNAIKVSNDLELNKKLAKEILTSIVKSEKLSKEDKFKFKAILSTLVYGGVQNIPELEKIEVQEKTKEQQNSFSFDILSILKNVAYIILGILGLLLLITGVFFVYYKVVNKDENVGFSDFILKKTKSNQVEENSSEDDFLGSVEVKEEKSDILGNINTSEVKTEEKETKLEKVDTSNETVPDWLKGVESDIDNKKEVKQTEKVNDVSKIDEKKEEKVETKQEEAVTDWLAGSFETSDKEEVKSEEKKETKKQESKPEETKVEEDNGDVPDWLAGSFDSDKEETKKEEQKEQQVEETKQEKVEEKSEKSGDIKTKEDSSIPDWLKGDIEEEVVKEVEKKQDKNEKSKEEKELDIEKETSLENEQSDIPDWLAGSFDSDKKEKTKETKKEEKSDIPDWLKSSLEEADKVEKQIKEETEQKEDKKEAKKATDKKEVKEKTEETKAKKEANTKTKKTTQTKKPRQTKKKEEQTEKKEASKKTEEKKTKKTSTTKKKTETKKEEKPKEDTSKKSIQDDLWDDGMEIPDWLKSD